MAAQRRWYDDDDCPNLDAPPSTYAADIEDQTRRLMAVALCVRDDAPAAAMPQLRDLRPISAEARIRLGFPFLTADDDAPGVRFPDRAAALDYLSQGDDVAIDQAAIDSWLESHSARDYLPESEG